MFDLVVVAFLEGFLTLSMLAPVIIPLVLLALVFTAGSTPSDRRRRKHTDRRHSRPLDPRYTYTPPMRSRPIYRR